MKMALLRFPNKSRHRWCGNAAAMPSKRESIRMVIQWRCLAGLCRSNSISDSSRTCMQTRACIRNVNRTFDVREYNVKKKGKKEKTIPYRNKIQCHPNPLCEYLKPRIVQEALRASRAIHACVQLPQFHLIITAINNGDRIKQETPIKFAKIME